MHCTGPKILHRAVIQTHRNPLHSLKFFGSLVFFCNNNLFFRTPFPGAEATNFGEGILFIRHYSFISTFVDSLSEMKRDYAPVAFNTNSLGDTDDAPVMSMVMTIYDPDTTFYTREYSYWDATDFKLQPMSPAVDTGTDLPVSLELLLTDFGIDEDVFGRYDIGFAELQQTP